MKNKICYSPEAQHDLEKIWDYIFFELSNPDAAENTVNKIMNKVDKLEDFSETGTPLSSVIDIVSDYRFLMSGHYMIFYHTSGQVVYVDRILYERRDYLRILFKDFEKDEISG